MTDARKARMVKNEVLFRSVNERMKELTDELAFDGVVGEEHREQYLCECVDADCTTRIELSDDEYERVRSNFAWFAVAPGHVVAEVERVVDEGERFWMVEKHPGEREIARHENPRS
ncbi:MAG: hypothetical protein ABR583_04535 [Gaiellaceae bacterium]